VRPARADPGAQQQFGLAGAAGGLDRFHPRPCAASCSVNITRPPNQDGSLRVTADSVAVSTLRSLPSGRAVSTSPFASTNATLLPSGDQAASVTVVGKVTSRPPTRTVLIPLEIKAIPAVYPPAAPGIGCCLDTGTTGPVF
jgi:hypothetical protein